ncbi:MAG: mechanosensitive ion channel [Deltaproteobacteria bacterium]|nr:MAG: mechanosensitive ion channel [Deltaproteobacteria bacterium]
MKMLQRMLDPVREFLNIPLLDLGRTPITLGILLHLVILVLLLFLGSGILRNWVVDRLLTRTHMEAGARQATGTILRYSVIAVGFIVILQTAGIDLTAVNVLAGAVGIGVGFGLQNIVNNFISGLIILFERPIKVGDRIEVGDVEGDVVNIGGRSTTVVTNDNITIIVPNAKFVTENVVNWSHNDRKVRFRVPVCVAHGSEVQQVERLLLEAAAECPDVLVDPPPAVRLMAFGDSGLEFELRVWSTTLIHRRGMLVSAVNVAIYRKFGEYGIEIPSPRRDLRILNGGSKVTQDGGDG